MLCCSVGECKQAINADFSPDLDASGYVIEKIKMKCCCFLRHTETVEEEQESTAKGEDREGQ